MSAFARSARLARAWEAIQDPEGEKEAVSPLTEEQAWAIIIEEQQRGRQPVDNSALIRALGIPEHGKQSGRLQCPAHGEGRKLTLSWRITQDGGLLLHCFAGCTFTEIRRAVGL